MAKSREQQIADREAAIRRRLHEDNVASRRKADNYDKYKTQHVAGREEGMTQSDYGAGDSGPGIPYKIVTQTQEKKKNPDLNRLDPAIREGKTAKAPKASHDMITDNRPKFMGSNNWQSNWRDAIARRLNA